MNTVTSVLHVFVNYAHSPGIVEFLNFNKNLPVC